MRPIAQTLQTEWDRLKEAQGAVEAKQSAVESDRASDRAALQTEWDVKEAQAAVEANQSAVESDRASDRAALQTEWDRLKAAQVALRNQTSGRGVRIARSRSRGPSNRVGPLESGAGGSR